MNNNLVDWISSFKLFICNSKLYFRRLSGERFEDFLAFFRERLRLRDLFFFFRFDLLLLRLRDSFRLLRCGDSLCFLLELFTEIESSIFMSADFCTEGTTCSKFRSTDFLSGLSDQRQFRCDFSGSSFQLEKATIIIIIEFTYYQFWFHNDWMCTCQDLSFQSL